MGQGATEAWAHWQCVHRKALEMSCAIQNQLARILAEFEMTLERDVLQPLSRLSEVTLPLPPSLSFPRLWLPSQPPEPFPCLPPGGAASHPETQEESAEAGVRLEHPQEQVGAQARVRLREGLRALRPLPHQDTRGPLGTCVYLCPC
jgi:hypothetical protein